MPDTLTIVYDTLRTMMGTTAAEPYVKAIQKAIKSRDELLPGVTLIEQLRRDAAGIECQALRGVAERLHIAADSLAADGPVAVFPVATELLRILDRARDYARSAEKNGASEAREGNNILDTQTPPGEYFSAWRPRKPRPRCLRPPATLPTRTAA